MMQIEGVEGVSMYVDNLPLKDANGVEVGILTNDSFVENPGEKINNIQEANLTLYFASENGDGLVRETQHVYYSSNTSIEKLVMEQLLVTDRVLPMRRQRFRSEQIWSAYPLWMVCVW